MIGWSIDIIGHSSQCTDTQKKELTEAVSNNSNSTIESAKAILTTVGDLKENLESVNQPVSNLSTLQTKANQVLPLASSSLTSMSSGFTQLQNAVDNQLVPGSQSIENGVNAYTKGLDTISLGVNQLNEKNTTLIMDTFKRLNKENKITVLINLHDVNLARKYSTKILGLKDGKILFYKDSDKVSDDEFEELYS